MAVGRENDFLIVSTSQLSQILGFKSIERVRQLEQEGALVRLAHGKYDLPKSIQQYLRVQMDHIEKKYNPEDGKLSPSQEDARLKAVKRELAEIELQLKKEELHFSEDVEILFSDMYLVVRSNLLNLPDRLASELSVLSEPHEIKERIRAAIFEAMEEISKWNPDPEAREEDGKKKVIKRGDSKK